jgi:DNA-binding NarL/FixJ family response regulator
VLNDATQWISEKLKQQTGITFVKDEKTVVRLSATEKQIMAFLKEGHTETEIARELAFSTSRVKRYIQILLMKYEVSSIEALLEVA